MQKCKHQPQITGDWRLPCEHELDLLLERVIAIVDLVVERDDLVAKLDVLRPERVHNTADRAEDDLAGLLEIRLEGIQFALELDPHPNLPVT